MRKEDPCQVRARTSVGIALSAKADKPRRGARRPGLHGCTERVAYRQPALQLRDSAGITPDFAVRCVINGGIE